MTLSGRTVVVLTYPAYQEMEFWYPVLRVREEGGAVQVVTPAAGEHESFLGYPVVGDVEAVAVDIGGIDAMVVPGTVGGSPQISADQKQLIKSAHLADCPIYASGSGAELVAELVGEIDETRRAADADGLPDLVRRLCADLAG